MAFVLHVKPQTRRFRPIGILWLEIVHPSSAFLDEMVREDTRGNIAGLTDLDFGKLRPFAWGTSMISGSHLVLFPATFSQGLAASGIR